MTIQRDLFIDSKVPKSKLSYPYRDDPNYRAYIRQKNNTRYATDKEFREKIKAYGRARYHANKSYYREYFTQWRKRNKSRYRTITARWRKANRARLIEQNARLKKDVFDAYGRLCSCCGVDDERFLTIDHIFGDGKNDRNSLYARLKKMGFPKDRYQVLCWNCNIAKKQNPQCPHKDIDEAQLK